MRRSGWRQAVSDQEGLDRVGVCHRGAQVLDRHRALEHVVEERPPALPVVRVWRQLERPVFRTVIRFPIRDVSVAADHESVERLVRGLLERSQAGENVVIHCEGGLGRTGTIAGCYLALFGHAADAILRRLVETRRDPKCPETEEQRQFIRDFTMKFQAR
jgi:Tyrosine phosphatase family